MLIWRFSALFQKYDPFNIGHFDILSIWIYLEDLRYHWISDFTSPNDLCGTETENLDDHHGYCPAELNLGPYVDRVFDAGEFLEHLMADEPRAEPPPIARRYIPGDHINNIEFLLNCFAKERTRQQ